MQIVIIGNGISGITAAREIRKRSDASILVISDESDYFFSRTALMYVYMGHMKFEHTQPYENWFWGKNKIDLEKGRVIKIKYAEKQVILANEKHIPYDKLIIATGSKSNKFGWPGQDLQGVLGLYHKQDLENLEKLSPKIKHSVIVGGGLIGIELAEMFHARGIHTTMLVREDEYWNNILPNEEAQMIGRHIREQGIDLRLSSELLEIKGDKMGYVEKVICKSGEEIKCQFVGLTAGVSPNIDFLKNEELECNRGILVNEYLESNIENVYAIGDCAEFRNPKANHPPVEQLWYTGRMQGETLARTICGERQAYQRGIWFNSAKFFDIEYQTYGMMFSKLKEGEESFYWEHAKGRMSFRITFEKESKKIIGMNFFGIRFKQTVADSFIREGKDVYHVMNNLKKGWFDPEFYNNSFPEILASFNHQFKAELIIE